MRRKVCITMKIHISKEVFNKTLTSANKKTSSWFCKSKLLFNVGNEYMLSMAVLCLTNILKPRNRYEQKLFSNISVCLISEYVKSTLFLCYFPNLKKDVVR